MTANRSPARARSVAIVTLAVALLAWMPGEAAGWEGLGDLGPASANPSGTYQTVQPVAIASYGRSVFVWGRGQAVLARGVKPSGALEWLRTVTGDGLDPLVAIDQSGEATVAWTTSSTHRLQTRTITAGGRMSAVKTLSAADVAPGPVELKVTPGGDALFMWRTNPGAPGVDQTHEAIQVRSRSAGGSFGPVQNVAVRNDPGSGPGLFPHVAIRSNGDAVFVWFRAGSTQLVRSRRRSADGTFGPIRTVATHAGQDPAGSIGTDTAVDLDPDGVPTFAWLRQDDSGPPGCCARVVTRTARGPVTPVSPPGTSASTPHVAVDGDGDALFAWTVAAGVRARARSADGSLGPVQRIDAHGSQEPSLGVSRTGDAVFAWMRVIAPAGVAAPPTVQPRARTRSATGVLGPPTPLGPELTDYASAAVAVNADGAAAAMFDAGRVEQGLLGP